MISIIIPAYNSSAYLKRCLDSIVRQSFEDYEVIVVNDGSTDDTKEVLDGYAQRYPRIKAVHKENEGVSIARNTGLERAKGEYVVFIDCDDYISDDALELINSELDENTDLYIYNNLIQKEDGISECLNSPSFPSLNILILETVEALKTGENEWLRTIWAKVYRREILKDVRFPLGVHIGQDACFLVDLFYYLHDLKRIKVIPKAWYVYDRTNELSATHKYKRDLYLLSKLQFDYLMKTVGRLEGDDRYRNTVLAKFCFRLFFILYYQGQFAKENDNCFKWYEYTESYINEKDVFPIDFGDGLMNTAFRYRHILSNRTVRKLFRNIYLSRNRKRNV